MLLREQLVVEQAAESRTDRTVWSASVRHNAMVLASGGRREALTHEDAVCDASACACRRTRFAAASEVLLDGCLL